MSGARYAVEGAAVLVPARVAVLLEKHLDLNRVRIDVRGRDRQVDEVLASWHAIAAAHRRKILSDPGRDACPNPDTPASSRPQGFTVAQVADRFYVSERHVRREAANGRLVGEQISGRWWFSEDDVAVWAQRRAKV